MSPKLKHRGIFLIIFNGKLSGANIVMGQIILKKIIVNPRIQKWFLRLFQLHTFELLVRVWKGCAGSDRSYFQSIFCNCNIENVPSLFQVVAVAEYHKSGFAGKKTNSAFDCPFAIHIIKILEVKQVFHYNY